MSLIINKNSLNTLSVTLNEKLNYTGTTILLYLKNNQTNAEKIVKMTGDTSSNPVRLNQYEVLETTLANEDLFNSSIYLDVGTYDYVFYSTFQTGLTTNGGAPVESGLLTVKGSTTSNNIFTGGSQTVIFK